ncbi:MAG: 2-succinyl-5-enolpyruvyl-6-hydroxy-3-cyclohexene-1-carboxylic-acid synthase [Actinomycetota bacterium]
MVDGRQQATFAATLVDEWVRSGMTAAVVAPGSRSTPMALALADRNDVALHVVHDERAAAFVALGLGIDGAPALLLCTSGTAAAHFLPAAVEASLSQVPMIMVTADRPAELRGVGAPQTIDQPGIYGSYVELMLDLGDDAIADRASWRAIAADVFAHATAGPVQMNLQFREPLAVAPDELPPPLGAVDQGNRARNEFVVDRVPDGFDTPRGVILAGGRSLVDPSDVRELAARSGWPVIADPLSGLRDEDAVTMADALLRHGPFANDHLPSSIVRVGRPAASRVLVEWTSRAVAAGAALVQVGGPGRVDPGLDVSAYCDLHDVLAAVETGAIGTPWAARWRRAEERARVAVEDVLDQFARSQRLTEPGVARLVATHRPAQAQLTVASSMPVRDLEWFGGPQASAWCNRGANGIDGTISTALGRSLAGHPSIVLLGDLAFVHDVNALIALAGRDADLRIVVIDNDGGGIFSFLPQARQLSEGRFEQLFGTPHGSDVLALAAAHGLPAMNVSRPAELTDQLAIPGPWVARVISDRVANVTVHEELQRAVAAAVDPQGTSHRA